MRVSFVWSAPTGYLAACLTELAAARGHDVQLLSGSAELGATRLYGALDAAAEWHRLEPAALRDPARVKELVTGFRPDAVVFSGWHNPACRALAHDPALARTGRLMTMDTPWQGTLRQRLGRILRGRYLARMHLVVTAGERARILARALGVPDARIRGQLYGFDATGFAAARTAPGAARPPGFLFVGRYAPEKGLATLAAAWRLYLARSKAPWPLHLCGRGPDDGGLRALPGVTDHGFVAPDRLPGVMQDCGAFVFPSLFEPFGVALLEACGAGLPVIASTAVGASVECVRDEANGFLFPAGDAEALAGCLLRMETAGDGRLAEMGASAAALAAPYAERLWALRFERHLHAAAAEARGG